MTRFKTPTGHDLTSIRDQFVANAAAQSISARVEDTTNRVSISLSKIYAYAKGEISYPDQTIETALKNTPGLRTAYRRMISGVSNYTFDRAIAASEGDLPARKTVGAEITFSNSSAHQDRVYVIIKLTAVVDPAPGALIVFDKEDQSTRIDLPAPQDGIIQALVAKNSDIISALKNPDTSVLLK
jgi:hypothetical protein